MKFNVTFKTWAVRTQMLVPSPCLLVWVDIKDFHAKWTHAKLTVCPCVCYFKYI